MLFTLVAQLDNRNATIFERIKMEKINYRKIQLPYKGSTGLPYTLAFCFPKSGPVVVAGPCKDVEKYVATKLSPCHYNAVYFKNGETRNHWTSNVPELIIMDRGYEKFYNTAHLGPVKHLKKQYKYTILYKKDGKRIETKVRNIPLRYLKKELG